ncbi:MAG: hypothetical protein KDC92_14735, partial [Bacteroidetes bacterium]|nr:hypothetical protein [Bacteroidota bacterium]
MSAPKHILLAILLLCIGNETIAQVISASISYNVLGNDTLTIQATARYKCGTKINDTLQIELLDKVLGGGITKAVSIQKNINRSRRVNCNDSSCKVQFTTAEFLYSIPISYFSTQLSDSILIKFTPGWRLDSLTNMTLKKRARMQVSAAIYNLKQANCSYNFGIKPRHYGLLNQFYMASPALYDADMAISGNSDSIYCELKVPDSPDSLGYNLGYSPYAPLKYDGYPTQQNLPKGFHFNHQTGDLRFIATEKSRTYIKRRIKEYRNGEMVGFIEQDQLIEIDNLNLKTQVVTGFNGSNFTKWENYDFTSCEKDRHSLIIKATNARKFDFDSLRIRCYNPLYKLDTFVADSARIRFSFPSRLSNQRIIFFVEAYNSHCDLHTMASATFRISNSKKPKPFVTKAHIRFRKYYLKVEDTVSNSPVSFTWKILSKAYNSDSITIEPKIPGTKNFTLTAKFLNGCSAIIKDTLTTHQFPFIEITPKNGQFCANSIIPVSSMVSNSNDNLAINWNTGRQGNSEQIVLKKDSLIIALLSHPDGFWNADTTLLKAINPPSASLYQDGEHCPGNAVSLRLKSLSLPANALRIVWRNANQLTIGKDTFLNVKGEQLISVQIQDNNGCSFSDSINTRYTKFAILPKATHQICHSDTLKLTAYLSDSSNANTFWVLNNDTFSNSKHLNYKVEKDAIFLCYLKINESNLTCNWEQKISVDEMPLPVFQKLEKISVCRNNNKLNLNDSAWVIPQNGSFKETPSSKGTLVNGKYFNAENAEFRQFELLYSMTNDSTGCS